MSAGNVARGFPIGGKSQRERKADDVMAAIGDMPAAIDTAGAAVDTSGDEDPADVPGEAVAGAVAAVADEKSQIERLITGYAFEDAPGVQESVRKPEKAGDPTVYTLRVARVHWQLAGTDYKLMSSTISRQRKVWSHLAADGESQTIDKTEVAIIITAPGVMLGSSWMPAITRYGARQPDPEFLALRERVRQEWLTQRRLAVASGNVVAPAAKAAPVAPMSAEELAAVGLS